MPRINKTYHFDYEESELAKLDDPIHHKLYMLFINDPQNRSKRKIASFLGVSSTTISKYMSTDPDKRNKPDTINRCKLSLFYAVPAYYLMEKRIPYQQDPNKYPCPIEFKGMDFRQIIDHYLEPIYSDQRCKVFEYWGGKWQDEYFDHLTEIGLTIDFINRLSPKGRSVLKKKIDEIKEEIFLDHENDEAYQFHQIILQNEKDLRV